MAPRRVGRNARCMGLFRHKPKVDDEPQRCPLCTENLPEGADACAMCGADLRALGVRTVRSVVRDMPGTGNVGLQRPEQDSNLRPTP